MLSFSIASVLLLLALIAQCFYNKCYFSGSCSAFSPLTQHLVYAPLGI